MQVDSWKEKYKVLFMALRIEKLVMFSILFMAIFIALLNMTSIMLVNVTSKKRDIAILTSLGLSGKKVAHVFFVQGLITGVSGVTLGLILGALLSINIDVIVSAVEKAMGFKVLSPDLYYISSIPSNFDSRDVLMIALASYFSVFLAALGPALLSAKLSLTRGLHSE